MIEIIELIGSNEVIVDHLHVPSTSWVWWNLKTYESKVYNESIFKKNK